MEKSAETVGSVDLKPPASDVGALGWIKTNLFNTPFNSFLTLLILLCLYKTVPPFIKWAFLGGVWFTNGAQCKVAEGACWSVVTQNLRFILFGFYPYEQQWRPAVAIVLLIGFLLYSRERRHWNRKLLVAWPLGLAVMGFIMRGGIFGLPVVETTKWSGIILTLLLAIFGLTAAYPLGVLLALGRRSQLPAIKMLSVIYIELIRGVPLISLLFMASVMFPLFLPEGITVDKILRAQVAIILFTAAYIAEVVRGGLQAIPKGQYEAAESLGLDYYQKMRLIILPQALKIVIPPTVSILISAFKDTSLVVIIGLFDLLKTTQVTLSNPEWMGFSAEAYLFISLVYFAGCFSMSNFSRRLEDELRT
ncbi:amino acid ABC transporter permease [Desulfoferrobacter suflitae]|uniref:amino acid ABC transporter permease n=1 Tax=Desulfoferrobacter suflitae TaxID=2865782 RepID=UPI0021643DDA|nr:amino acid ABC transporter permease [Desulfoferrobacter suflitae]MCK8602157.1 amino acid ABC transporter permease [Desulfoferrobacter suflitae]